MPPRSLPLLKQEHPIKNDITSLILSPYMSLSSIWLSLPHRLGGGAVFSDQGEGGPEPTSLHPVGVASQACPPTATLGYPLLRMLELTENSELFSAKSRVFQKCCWGSQIIMREPWSTSLNMRLGKTCNSSELLKNCFQWLCFFPQITI